MHLHQQLNEKPMPADGPQLVVVATSRPVLHRRSPLSVEQLPASSWTTVLDAAASVSQLIRLRVSLFSYSWKIARVFVVCAKSNCC